MKFQKKQPIVRVNMAQTLDGHVIFPNGNWQTTSREDQRRMDHLREWADALLVSRATINNDNPNLSNRSKPQKKRQPELQVIMQKDNGNIREDAKIFQPPHKWGNFWVNSLDPKWHFLKNYNQEKITKIQKNWKLKSFSNPKEIISNLFENGCSNILIEGGPRVNGLFFTYNLIDEIFLTKVPYLFGGNSNDRIVVTSTMLNLKKFRLRRVQHRKNEVFLHYTRYSKNSSIN